MDSTIRDYDAQWPELARLAATEITTALGDAVVDIEHVGSTSVPRLAAKPIIDLMASTPDLAAVVAADPLLADLGYLPVPIGMRERLFYVRRREGSLTHHLHVVTVPTWATRKERLFRDHLRASPDDRRRYAELKRQLMDQHGLGDDYTRGKTELIQEITDRARAAQGLFPIPVWET